MTTVVQALTAVMEDVGAVRKSERNQQQGFSFRGIDAVVSAVSPALRAHGVVVTPEVRSYEYGTVEVGQKRTPMGHARVVVAYTFHGPQGDSITAVTAAESMDSGDKATAKAMSVAFRTALLQALALPTDEPDPDATSYERSPQPETDEQWLAGITRRIGEALSVSELRGLWSEVGSQVRAGKCTPQDATELTETIKAAQAALPAPEAAPAEQQELA